MDAMKNAADFDDEEIIDLTDIIEKGAAPAHKGGDLLDDQLSDLTSASHDDGQPSIDLDMDADIDALLAQMGGDPSESASENSIPGMGQESAHHQDVNPDETLDMPGMAEVDSLLQELDMPPQPDSTQSDDGMGDLDDSPASPASAVDLDALLDGMLEGNSAPQAAPKEDDAPASAAEADPSATPSPDFAAALSADLDDLDALLGNNEAAPAPAAAPAAAPADSDLSLDDLDALLGNNEAAPAPAAAPAAAPADSDLSLDDLDALLGNNEAAPAPAAAPAAAPAGPAGSDLSLDDLDALLGNNEASPAPAAAPAPAPAGPAGSDLSLDDLDALLGNNEAAPAPAAAPAHAPTSPDLSLDDLDALLGNNEASPAPAAAKPQPVMDLVEPINVADLDALLGQANIPTTATPDYVPDVADLASLDSLLGAATTPAHEPSPDTLNMLKNFDDTPLMPHAADTSVPSLTEDLMALDVMLNAEAPAQEEPSAQAAPAQTAPVTTRELLDSAPPAADDSLLADLDALLSGATLDLSFSAEDGATQQASAEDGDTWRDPLPGFDAGEIQPDASAVDSLLEDIDPQELNRAAQELLDEKVMLEATTGDVDTSAWLSSLDEALDEVGATDEVSDKAIADNVNETAAAALPEDVMTPADDTILHEGIVPSMNGEQAEDDTASLPEGIVPPMPLAAAAALGATAVAMAASKGTAANAGPAAAAALSEEDRARISELEERLMVLEEQWQTRDASHRQLLDHMGTQDLHHSERLSALEARLASVQSEAQAETNARLTQLEFRLDDVINQPAPAPTSSLSEEDEELRAARLDLMDGRIMVLEDAEEQRCAREKAAEEKAADMPADATAEDMSEELSTDAPHTQLSLSTLEERLSALENQTAQGQVELEERLTALEGQFRHLESTFEERLSALQGQFQQLESAMEERLEQKAAAAAAKIIREEIAALLTE